MLDPSISECNIPRCFIPLSTLCLLYLDDDDWEDDEGDGNDDNVCLRLIEFDDGYLSEHVWTH